MRGVHVGAGMGAEQQLGHVAAVVWNLGEANEADPWVLRMNRHLVIYRQGQIDNMIEHSSTSHLHAGIVLRHSTTSAESSQGADRAKL